MTKNIWDERFEDIRAWERYFARNGFVIRKFFLNVSKKEQKRRFLDRLQQPEKNWKFSSSDLHEREHWDDYMHAYEDMIANTASRARPLVCHSRRQQMVHTSGGGCGHRRHA